MLSMVLTMLSMVCLAVGVFFTVIYPMCLSFEEADGSSKCGFIFLMTAMVLGMVGEALREKEVLSDMPEDEPSPVPEEEPSPVPENEPSPVPEEEPSPVPENEPSPVFDVICFVSALAVVACYFWGVLLNAEELMLTTWSGWALAILGVRVLFRWRGIMFTVFITGMCWPDTGEYFRGGVLEIYL